MVICCIIGIVPWLCERPTFIFLNSAVSPITSLITSLILPCSLVGIIKNTCVGLQTPKSHYCYFSNWKYLLLRYTWGFILPLSCIYFTYSQNESVWFGCSLCLQHDTRALTTVAALTTCIKCLCNAACYRFAIVFAQKTIFCHSNQSPGATVAPFKSLCVCKRSCGSSYCTDLSQTF